MKRPLVLLALSLTANAVLLVSFFLRPNPENRRPEAVALPAAVAALAPGSTALSPADAGALKRTGELITEGNLRTLVARLRAADFPPAIIRAIVTAQLTEQYGLRRKAVVANQEVVPYWISSQSFPHDAKAGAELASLGREQTARLKELLGADSAPSDEWSRLIQQRKYGDLAQDKIDRLQGITNDYTDLRSQITADAHGVFLPEDQQKFILLEKEQRADIVKLFTPEELEDYDLRNSRTAGMLRSQLSAFHPTEEEFKLLFRLTDPVQSRIAALYQTSMETGNNDSNREAQAAETKLRADIEAALGPARAAEYRDALNPAYRSVALLLTRLELPASLTPQIVSVQQDIQQRADVLRKTRTLSVEDRNSQLAILAQEAEAKLTATLGAQGFKSYVGFAGGWLTGIVPRPAPKPFVPPKT